MNRQYTKPLSLGVAFMSGLFGVLILVLNLTYPGHNHFSLLAHSFVEGRAFFTESQYRSFIGNDSMHDAALYRGRYFWPLGPLPAILMIPFTLTSWERSTPTAEGIINLITVAGMITTLYVILKRWFMSAHDRAALVLAFIAGSPLLYIVFIPKSWFVAHSITTACILFAFYEYYSKRRYWVVGMLFALALATRATALFGIGYFFFTILSERSLTIRVRLKHFVELLAPVVLVAGMLGIYNFIRFDSFIEQGYRYQLIAQDLEHQRSIGLFSTEHIATNLYYLLLAPPHLTTIQLQSLNVRIPIPYANPWGMSILITSPYLLYLFLTTLIHQQRPVLPSRVLLIVFGITLIPLLMYYGVGFYQFGYRYALDCFPFLFLAFVIEYQQSHPTLSPSMVLLIIVSAIVNLYFVFTLFCTKLYCS